MGYLEDPVDGPRALARDLMASALDLPIAARGSMSAIATLVGDRASEIAAGDGSASIPASIDESSDDGGAEVDAGGADVPMAGLWEYGNRGGGSSDTFRHPVFGHQDVQVEQPRYPFLKPALDDEITSVYELAEGAYDTALTPHRLHPDSETI